VSLARAIRLLGTRPAPLSKTVRAQSRPLGDRVDGHLCRRALVGLEPVNDSESLVARVPTRVALPIEVRVSAIDDMRASDAGSILGARPRVVPERRQRRDCRPLHGDEYRLVLKLGELAGQRVAVASRASSVSSTSIIG
jgi:hypothetical protein